MLPAAAAPRELADAGLATGRHPRTSALPPRPLLAMDAAFAAGKVPLVDDFLVIRCGRVAFERHYSPRLRRDLRQGGARARSA
jgi:hypothetical protein